MNQEICVNLNLTLDSSTELSKEEIAKQIEATFNTLLTSLNSPLSGILSKYKGGDLLLDTCKVKVNEVLYEAEIYQSL